MTNAPKLCVLLIGLMTLVACGGGDESAEQASDGRSQISDASESVTEDANAPRRPGQSQMQPVDAPVSVATPSMSEGHRWYLVDASDGGIAGQIDALRAEFQLRSLLLAGKTSCNRFDAGMTYTSDGQLRIEQPKVTRGRCDTDALKAAEFRFFQTLPKMRRYQIVGDRLRIETEDSTEWLEFGHGFRPKRAG